jgi:hypothetical protein
MGLARAGALFVHGAGGDLLCPFRVGAAFLRTRLDVLVLAFPLGLDPLGMAPY